MEKRYPLGPCTVVLAQGDITREATDAIANAANAGLLGGGGVDGAIHRAAGPELLAACREAKKTLAGGRLPTGQAIATPGFRLRARHVIHCVGPIYDDDPAAAPPLLASCYRRALELCRALGLASIAFPAISTGVYGYPMREAAEIALAAIRDELARHAAPGLVKVVLLDARAFQTFVEVADRTLA
jgi:O-acetyl-ADP-ribose deacetylase (regulator of RNase III)